jgi:two-component system response regulator MprA
LDSSAPRILIVDDEPAVRSSLNLALELEGFVVTAVEDGAKALAALNGSERHDAVVLDVSMPHIDGMEVCRRLRAAGNRVPILMLTARDAIDDRVAGLEAGADDYLPKPFALRELIARLRAIMRRRLPDDTGTGPDADRLAYAGIRLDRREHRGWSGERMLELTRTEYLLLEAFLEHPRIVLSRSQIQLRVWGHDFGSDSNSLGVYVGYLRRKLEAGGEPRLLHTVRGVGYVLRADA